MIRVVIADDQQLIRAGFRALLSAEPDIDVVAEAATGTDAVAAVRAHRPDVVLMDLVMEGMDGVETTQKLLELYPDCKVIVLTSYLDDSKMYPVIEAGAFSYLLKTSRATEIADVACVYSSYDA